MQEREGLSPARRPAPEQLKDWRSFGSEEWRHVQDGGLGLLMGSVLPVLLFYATYRLWSFPAAVAVVLAWSAMVFVWHRRRTGGGDVFSGATFGFACLQALIGFVSQNHLVYLAAPSLENLVYGSAFLGSALARRPLLGLYARRLYPIPAPVRESVAFQRAFLHVSAAWFVGLAVRAMLRLWLLAVLPLELYLVANTLTGWPFSVALVSLTVWYPLRMLQRAGLMAQPPRVVGDVEEAVEEAAPGFP